MDWESKEENLENGIKFAEYEGSTKKKKAEFPKAAEINDLKIVAFPTDKSEILQRPAMAADIIPRHASSCIFNGSSGSGKTMLLVNLLTRPQFYGPDANGKRYFELIFMFSPTADNGDDLVNHLKLDKKHIFTEFDISTLENIISTQKNIITSRGLKKSPKILIIFEDIQSDSKFMNSKPFLKCFIQCRHLNISTFLLGQSWTKTPRACRLQANNIFFYQGSGSEVDLLVNEFCPPKMKKKDFEDLIDEATKKKYSFLHINKRVPFADRFREGLDTIFHLDNLQ